MQMEDSAEMKRPQALQRGALEPPTDEQNPGAQLRDGLLQARADPFMGRQVRWFDRSLAAYPMVSPFRLTLQERFANDSVMMGLYNAVKGMA
jgi:hypothetical protein